MSDGFPSDDDLRAADKIVLVDPKRPDWRMPLHVRAGNRTGNEVKIEVDSTNLHVLTAWMDRIKRLGLNQ